MVLQTNRRRLRLQVHHFQPHRPRSVRIADAPGEFADALDSAKREAASSFGVVGVTSATIISGESWSRPSVALRFARAPARSDVRADRAAVRAYDGRVINVSRVHDKESSPAKARRIAVARGPRVQGG